MTRATTVYLSTFVASAVGLWAVLLVGGRLRAPADFSGYWEVRPVGEGVFPIGEGLLIEQSGKYARVHFESGRRVDLKLAELSRRGAGDGESANARFVGDGWTLTIDARPVRHDGWIVVAGPVNASFNARRTVNAGGGLIPEPAAADAGAGGRDENESPVTAAATEATGPNDALRR